MKHATKGWLWLLPTLAFALFLKLGIVAEPYHQRALLPEVDDTYAYILTGVQFMHCPGRGCPGITSLLEQSQPDGTLTDKDNLDRWDLHHRLWLFHSPLWAAAMAGMNVVGISWENAFFVLNLLSAVIVMTGLAAIAAAFVGPRAAGVTLLIMALLRFPGHGLYWFVPGDCALGIALWYSSYAIRQKGGGVGMLTVAVLTILSLHSIGRIYAVFCLSVFALCQGADLRSSRSIRDFLRAHWLCLAGLLLLIGASWWPTLRFSPPPLPPLEQASFQSSLAAGLSEAGRMLALLAQSSQPWNTLGPVLFFGLAGVGLVSMPANRRSLLLHLVLITLLLLAGSVLYFHPTHPATLFSRLLVPAFLFLAIPFGLGVVWLIDGWLALSVQIICRPSRLIAIRTAGLTGLLVLLGLTGAAYGMSGLRQHMELLDVKTVRQDGDFKLKPWLDIAADCQSVGYDNMHTVFVYLTWGGYACKANFITSAYLGHMTAAELGLSHAILSQPGWKNRGRLTATRAFPIRFDFISPHRGSLALLFSAETVGRRIAVGAGDGVSTRELKIEAPGWVEISQEVRSWKTVIVTPLDSDKPFDISGLRLSSDTATRWPWTSDVRATALLDRYGQSPVSFAFSDKLTPLQGYSITVTDDSGSALFLRLTPNP